MKKNKKMKKVAIALSVASLLTLSTHALATTMTYTQTDNGSNNYTLNFTITNDTLDVDLESFSVFFGDTTNGLDFTNTDQYKNLTPDSSFPSTTQNSDWDTYSFEAITSFNLPAQFNADATGSGIANGESLDGFQVSFDWTGGGGPYYYFETYDPNNSYSLLDSGYATLITTTNNVVPEPATFLLFGTGIAGLAALRRRKSFHS